LVLVALLVLTPYRPFPAYEAWQLRAMTLAAFLISVLLIGTGVVGLVDAHRRAGVELDRARARALGEAVSRTRDLETVSAKVAHEIRNPLVSIKGLVQLLAKGAAERDVKRFEVVLSEVERLESIVKDYLSFARPIESLKPVDMDLSRLLVELAAVVEPQATPQGVKLRVTAAENLRVHADEIRLRQALLNLVLNALEATPSGGSVEISGRQAEQKAEVVVRDSGRGMAADVLARVGTAFFTTRERGTGLGVAIARGIVEQHGGSMRFESEPGRGTTVTAQLPLEPRAAVTG
jgi:signal transduction histidine kinase